MQNITSNRRNRLYLTAVAALLGLFAASLYAQDPKTEPPKPDQPAAPAAEPKDATAKAKDAPVTATEAEKRLDAQIEKLRKIKNVSAEIVERVHMLGQSFEVRGEYVKSGDKLFRLELNLSGLGDTTGTMIQVSDGNTIWDFHKVVETSSNTELAVSYRKRDIMPILQKIDDPAFDPAKRAEIKPKLGLAGPEALLEGLRRDVRFNTVDEDTFESRPVLIFRGMWSDRSKLALNVMPGAKPDAPLPDYVPTAVTLWVGKDDGWPYQVRLSGRKRTDLEIEQDDQKANTGVDGRPLGGRAVTKDQIQPTEILLAYTNVNFNPKTDPAKFAFEVPSDKAALVRDETEYLASLFAQMLQERTDRQKAEEAQEPPGNEPPAIRKQVEGAASGAEAPK